MDVEVAERVGRADIERLYNQSLKFVAEYMYRLWLLWSGTTLLAFECLTNGSVKE